MSLPFFYVSGYYGGTSLQLDEANSRHMVAVLRMQAGEQVLLTDGKGHLLEATITDAHKKKAVVQVMSSKFQEAVQPRITLAISPVKNNSRFEWMLEKVAEIGVASVIPLICNRTEKLHFKQDRMQQILVSALLQSQQVWLPELTAPMAITDLLKQAKMPLKWIAHCLDTDRVSLREKANREQDQLLLIGPEGDFTPAEIDAALQAGFEPVVLGTTRLRTETAGVVGATLLCIH